MNRKMNELWEDVYLFKGRYKISTLGNVKSLNYNNTGAEGLLKSSAVKGYLYVLFILNNKRKIYKIHRLVAQTFIPNPDNKPCVNHIDGNKQNNRVNNIEWVTASENIKHSIRILGNKTNFQLNNPLSMKGKIGILNHNSKKVNQYDLEGNFIKTWDCIRDIDRSLKINQSSIGKCCKGKVMIAGGFTWKYFN